MTVENASTASKKDRHRLKTLSSFSKERHSRHVQHEECDLVPFYSVDLTSKLHHELQ